MRFTIDHDHRYILAEAASDVDYQAMVAEELQLESEPDYVREYPRVFDFSSVASPRVQTQQLLDLVKTTRTFDVDDHTRIALVGSHPDTVRMLHLYASHFHEQPIRVFTQRDRAIEWVMVASDSAFEETEFAALRFHGLVTLDEVMDSCASKLADSPVLLVDLRDAATSMDAMRSAREDTSTASRKGYIAFAVQSHFMSMLASRIIDLLQVEGGVFRSLSDAIAALEAHQ